MNAVPNRRVIEEVALELAIIPAFVEKDWYVVQILQIIQSTDLIGAKSVFAGGTALAKAHQLLQRFSEDIDFRIVDSALASLTRSEQRKRLSSLKELIQQAIVNHFPVDNIQVKARDENHFFSFQVEYPSQFTASEALRPHVLVEFTVTDLALPPIVLPVYSFVAQLTGAEPEVPAIACIDPVETAVDKLSALLWRAPDRIYEPQDDDPDLVRHIHDLETLRDRAMGHKDFRTLAVATIAKDDDRCPRISGKLLTDKVSIMMETLESDKDYPQEYDRFVHGMSYSTSKAPDYQAALGKLRELTNYLLEPNPRTKNEYNS